MTAWLDSARMAARQIAQKKGEVTIDDVREVCAPPDDCDPRIMGAVFHNREFVRTGFMSSGRQACHGRPIGIFQLRTAALCFGCCTPFTAFVRGEVGMTEAGGSHPHQCKCARGPWRPKQRNCILCNREANKKYRDSLQAETNRLMTRKSADPLGAALVLAGEGVV